MEKLLTSQSILEDLNISFSSTIIALTFSFFSALFVRFLYLKYGRSLNNREYFGNIFMLLSITTCTVIIIVKYSLALSLGLVGALSIVRFRAAIKEPEELVYLFLVIALGLSFGANQFVIGLIFLIFASIAIIFSTKFDKNISYDHIGMMIVISGPKQKIQDLRNKDLQRILVSNTFTTLKEIEYSGDFGKLVLRASTNEGISTLVEDLENLSLDGEINLNIISDVTIPA